MGKHEPLHIFDVEILPGESKWIHADIAKLFDNTQMRLPVKVIRGQEDGPRLFISGAIHGDEILGVEIIRRLLAHKKLSLLRGTLIAAPIVNIFGYNSMSRYLPDRRDLNRSFPGSRTGSLASRIANIFMEEIVANCTHGIDIHTGALHRYNLPQVRADLDDPATRELAMAFGVPVLLNARSRDGSLREAASQMHIPMLVYEGGEALRYDEKVVRLGLRGILSVMRSIGMIPSSSDISSHEPMNILEASRASWVRSPSSGSLITKKGLGAHVQKNELIGQISNPWGEIQTSVLAPFEGLIIGIRKLPLVSQGDALFHIAAFEDVEILENWVEEGFALV